MALWKHSLRNIFPGHRGAVESGLLSGQTYAQKVLSLGPIAYWPLYETSGTTAVCLVNPLQNGTYKRNVTIMGTGAGIGDGNTAPVFDGTNDAVNVGTATFLAALSGNEGTAAFWGMVANAGVWTDGLARVGFRAHTDFNNFLDLSKDKPNNLMQTERKAAAGATEGQTPAAGPSLLWFHYAATWSRTNNQIYSYVNGVQSGPATCSNNWVGAFNPDRVNIGSFAFSVPADVWSGSLSHCVVWNVPLAAAVIADLATV